MSLLLGFLILSLSWLLGMSSVTELWLYWNMDEHCLWASVCTAILCHICDQMSLRKSVSLINSSATDQQHISKATSYSLQWLKTKCFCLERLSNLQKSCKNRTKKSCVLHILSPDSPSVNIMQYLLYYPFPLSLPLSLLPSFLPSISPCLLPSLYIDWSIYFFPKLFGSCKHHDQLLWISPKNKDILLLNRLVIKVRNFNSDAILLFNS